MADCLARIDQAVDGLLKFFGRKPVIGRTENNVFIGQRRIQYRNPCQTIVEATLEAEDVGTRIQCVFRLPYSAVIVGFLLLGVLFIVFVVISVKIVIALLFGVPHQSADLLLYVGRLAGGILLTAGFAAAGAGIGIVCRWIAGDERTFLIDFLCETLDASAVAPPPTSSTAPPRQKSTAASAQQ